MQVKLSSLTVNQKFQLLRRQVGRECLEREYHIDALVALFICKNHGVLLGPPGTGKTYLIELLCNSIVGSEFFSILASPTTKPDEFFGPVSIKQLQDNETYARNTKGRLPQADFAYGDEFFKCPSAVLNTLLKLINERVFFNPDAETVPLRTFIGSSNEVPSNDPTAQALLDRFVWKNWVGYLQDEDNVNTLWERSVDGHKSNVTIKLTTQDMDQALALAKKVRIKPVFSVLQRIKAKLKFSKFVISDRKWTMILSFLQSFAWVKGHSSVSLDTLREVLPDCIWTKPEDKNAIAEIIDTEIDASYKELTDVETAIAHSVNRVASASDSQKLPVCHQEIKFLDGTAGRVDNLESLGIFPDQRIAAVKESLYKAIADIKNQIELLTINKDQQDIKSTEKTVKACRVAANDVINIPDTTPAWFSGATAAIKNLIYIIKEIENAAESSDYNSFARVPASVKQNAITEVKQECLRIKTEMEKRTATLGVK
jgi:MoxR-like ATPase